MPKGSWKPPEAGDAPQEVKDILKKVYSDYRDKHPAENAATKKRGARIAWTAVKNAGWHKNKDDKWTKKGKEMADVNAKDFVIFKAGHWNGEDFTEQDLDNMAKSFNSDEPIPIIIGHGSDYKGHTRIPAFGQILGGLKRIGKDLVAQGAVFNEKLANWIREGFYNQRSIELTKDNKRVLAVGMLGAVPPAVKGLPAMDEALNDIALQFAEDTEIKSVEFADAEEIEMTVFDEIEGSGADDTFKNISESCARYLEEIDGLLTDSADDTELCQTTWDFQNEIINELNLHSKFVEKLEQIKDGQEEYSDTSIWKEFREWAKQLIHKHKENNVEAVKEKEYQDKIAKLETENKEFAEKERLANEAKLKAEQEAQEAAKVAAEEAKKAEIKAFCDQAVKDNKMTPAIREKDEPIMFDLAKKDPELLKSFQEKYNIPIVPLGKLPEEIETNDKRLQVIKNAEKYVKAHAKDFVGLTPEEANSKALKLYFNKQITFEDKK
jgi:cation transport regulator ChaB